LSYEIQNVVEYHPTKKFGSPNPLFSNSTDSKKLLDLKDPTNLQHKTAINYYVGKLKSYLQKNSIDLKQFDFATIVPSSQKGQYSLGVEAVLNFVCEGIIPVKTNVLIRTVTIQSMHSGGFRHPDTHKNSIGVDRSKFDITSKILLVDDITTTGTTLTTCAQILETFGVSEIYLLAIGKTI
jgi:predicted amidophosphoribosyltransferase